MAKIKKLKGKKRTRLECEVECLINSREEIPSSRVLADTIVALVEDTLRGKRKPVKDPSPWGKFVVLPKSRGMGPSEVMGQDPEVFNTIVTEHDKS